MNDRTYKAVKAHVHNRGVPPDSFLDKLIEWARTAPDEIFASRPAPKGKQDPDVYASVHEALGPWRSLANRKAAMCEVLRVLAGFESSWNWHEGVDLANRHSVTHIEGQETGVFQVSFDSFRFDPTLRGVLERYCDGKCTVEAFIVEMKKQPAFALDYAARLLRSSVSWDGPLQRHELHPFLSRAAAQEFETFLA
jgi:hypothetical protein